MKTNVLILAFSAVISILLIGCKLNSSSNYTPSIGFQTQVYVNSDSTIDMKYDSEYNIILDSVHVNDTITIGIYMNGYINNLQEFNYSINNPDKIQILQIDSISQYFTSSSDFSNGKLYFKDNIVWMGYPFKFIARGLTDNMKIKFTVISDAVEVANEVSAQIQFPIKPEIVSISLPVND